LDAYLALECLIVSDWHSEIPILEQVRLDGIQTLEEKTIM